MTKIGTKNPAISFAYRIVARGNERGIIACIADILPVPIRRIAVSKLLLRNQPRSRIQWRCERGAKENPSVVVNEVTARARVARWPLGNSALSVFWITLLSVATRDGSMWEARRGWGRPREGQIASVLTHDAILNGSLQSVLARWDLI